MIFDRFGVLFAAGGSKKHSAFLIAVLLAACAACSRSGGSTGVAAVPASQLPVLLVDTGGRAISRAGKVPGIMTVVEQHDGSLRDIDRQPVALHSKVGIELHGETSLDLPKKSYDFEFRDDQGDDRHRALLGLPAGSDWTLKGCGRDDTCLRDAFVFALTRDFGRYAPRTRFVELLLDAEYRGLYVLMEKVRRDKHRVDLPKPADDASSGDISGGYIFELDMGEGEPGDAVPRDWVSPASQLMYSYSYPRYDNITAAQKAYLEDYVSRFEMMMQGRTWNDPRRGYRAWIDVPSWVDFAIVQELSNNPDAYFKSVYFQKLPKSEDNRLAMGPVWDFDVAFGAADFRGGRSTDVWAHTMNRFGKLSVPYNPAREITPVPAYWERLWSDRAFLGDLKCRWTELRKGPLSIGSLNERIDSWGDDLSQAYSRDSKLWRNADDGGYRGELEYLKSWLEKRTAWMDANLPGICPAS